MNVRGTREFMPDAEVGECSGTREFIPDAEVGECSGYQGVYT